MESTFLIHSAKGTTWNKKSHKYTRKVGKTYYYDLQDKFKDKADAVGYALMDKSNEKRLEAMGTAKSLDRLNTVVSYNVNKKHEYDFKDYERLRLIGKIYISKMESMALSKLASMITNGRVSENKNRKG